MEITNVKLSQVIAGNNDRRAFDQQELEELAASIQRDGLAQPPTYRPLPDGRLEIVAGERRTRACRDVLGWTEIPAIVRELDDKAASTIMLVENVNRVDLDPMAEAAAYQERIERFGMSAAEIAEATGKSKEYVQKRVGLLALVDDVRKMVTSGALPIGHAEAMTGLSEYYQTQAVKILNDTAGMPPLRKFRAMVGELQAIQDQPAMFDLEAYSREKVAELESKGKRTQRATGLRRNGKMPSMEVKQGGTAKVLLAYMQQLEDAGLGDEALAVSTLLDELVKANYAAM
jgi:ParB family chromosome partitioning protein